MKLYAWTAAIALSSAVAACDSASGASRVAKAAADSVRTDSIARARQDSINRAQPGYVVDSILPIDEAVRRFKAKAGDAEVTSLQHSSPSRDALVARIVADVAKGDSIDLALAAITPREFIDLVYPSSPYTRPPYRQAPGLVWMSIANHSQSGYTRLVRRRGGEAFSLESYSCEAKPEVQGENRLWSKCILRLENAQHETTTQRWFGTILERGGQFKLIGYSNQF